MPAFTLFSLDENLNSTDVVNDRRPIRVAMISVHGNPLVPDSELGSDGKGGQNVYVREVGKELSNQNCDVTWFTRSESTDEVGIVEISPTLRCQYIIAGPQEHINRDILFQYLEEFIEQIDTSNFDVLLTNYWLSGFVGLTLRLKSGLPQAHIHHSMGAMKYEHVEMPEIGPIRLKVEDMINKRVECMIHQTDAETTLCKATNPTLIKAGINTERFEKLDKQIAKKQLGFRDDVVNVLFAGRFAAQKGIPFAIEALKDTKVPHAFRLIGNTSGMPELVEQNPQCEFLGPKIPDELAVYMAASDILIMPSLYEPFGIVAIEAMAAGCCLIVTATGGLNEIVEHGVNGFKVPPGDATAIREAFETMVADSVTMEDMHLTNIQQAIEKHSWKATASKIQHELAALVNRISAQGRPPTMTKPVCDVIKHITGSMEGHICSSRHVGSK